MPVFRIACAIGLLFILAPEKTGAVLRSLAGAAQEARADLPGGLAASVPMSPEQALAACRQYPEMCMEVARTASKTR